MWMIGIAAGSILLLSGILVKSPLRRGLRILGAVLLAFGLLYGGLTLLLLSGIR